MDTQEDAFFAALLVIVKTAVAAGMDRTVLADQLQQVAAAARADNCQRKAATLEIVAAAANPKRYGASLHVIEGGKSGQNSN
jgi:hypothetical protein